MQIMYCEINTVQHKLFVVHNRLFTQQVITAISLFSNYKTETINV